MSFANLFFPITTVALSIALWSCWRSGKPAREAKRLKAEQDAKNAREEARRIAEAQFTADVISVLDGIYSGRIEPGRQCDWQGNARYSHPSVKLLQDMKGDREVIERILGRADRTHARMNDLENGLHDIRMTLRPYHPRSCPSNEFPVIRKG
ncbi:hypothetical protein [Pseudomonas phage Pf17397_F_PD1]|nr:hypothetical protein [Pseudomonas phage Pf17397_F_PD1]